MQGPCLARRIEQRCVAQRTRIGCEPLSPTSRMHITTQQRDAKLVRQRGDMLRVEVRIRAKVMVHMDCEHAAA
jgi:hypothetical protein